MSTWPGKSARDVILGGMGGYIAAPNPDPVFGLAITGPDGNVIIVAIVIVAVLYTLESVLLNSLWKGKSDEEEEEQQKRRPRITP